MTALTTVDELRTQIQQAYRQWNSEREPGLRCFQRRLEWPGFGENLLRGVLSVLRLFPETQFPSAGLSRRYVCGRSWDRDWQRVGEDIFQALITFDPRDSSSATGTRTSHPAHTAGTR